MISETGAIIEALYLQGFRINHDIQENEDIFTFAKNTFYYYRNLRRLKALSNKYYLVIGYLFDEEHKTSTLQKSISGKSKIDHFADSKIEDMDSIHYDLTFFNYCWQVMELIEDALMESSFFKKEYEQMRDELEEAMCTILNQSRSDRETRYLLKLEPSEEKQRVEYIRNPKHGYPLIFLSKATNHNCVSLGTLKHLKFEMKRLLNMDYDILTRKKGIVKRIKSKQTIEYIDTWQPVNPVVVKSLELLAFVLWPLVTLLSVLTPLDFTKSIDNPIKRLFYSPRMNYFGKLSMQAYFFIFFVSGLQLRRVGTGDYVVAYTNSLETMLYGEYSADRFNTNDPRMFATESKSLVYENGTFLSKDDYAKRVYDYRPGYLVFYSIMLFFAVGKALNWIQNYQIKHSTLVIGNNRGSYRVFW